MATPTDDSYRHVAPTAVVAQALHHVFEMAAAHQHHQGLQAGQGSPVERVGVVGGDHPKAVAQHRVGEGNARQQWGRQGRGNAGDDFHRAVGFTQGLHFGGGAAKDKGVAAFETHDPATGQGKRHQELVDLGLGRARLAAAFADVDAIAPQRQQLQQGLIHQGVVHQAVGPL